ncbi:DUF2250 domain-containing protein [Halobacteriales archaeon QS_6_71_20]|nr:MAG: DUF2250 domain-containing protein [Halobacteriales archaeon QS_6_71_20]
MPQSTSLSDADERVLRHLERAGADYPALVAANTGLHIPLVERRVAALADRGLVEAATAEEIYRVTDAGRRALAPDSTAADDAAPASTATDGGHLDE